MASSGSGWPASWGSSSQSLPERPLDEEEHAERPRDVAAIGRGIHGIHEYAGRAPHVLGLLIGIRRANLRRGRTIRDVCPGGKRQSQRPSKAVRSQGQCGFDSPPRVPPTRPGPGPVPARAAGRIGPQGPTALRPRSGRGPADPTARRPGAGRTNVLL